MNFADASFTHRAQRTEFWCWKNMDSFVVFHESRGDCSVVIRGITVELICRKFILPLQGEESSVCLFSKNSYTSSEFYYEL